MTLLLREPIAEGDASPQSAPPATAPEARTCPRCGTELAAEQDWCLNCGQASPGLLGARPGKRAIATVAVLTLALCGGAVAAAYAALQKDTGPPPPVVAQAPPPVATPAPAAAPPPAPVDPSAGQPVTPPDEAPVPAPAPPAPPTPIQQSPAPTGSGANSGSGTTSGTSKTRTTTTPVPPAPVELELGSDAAQLYDPYKRSASADASAEPTRALDGDPGTSWRTSFPAGTENVGVGVLVDLGKQTAVRVAELQTKTPGFRTEIYATDSEELPPDILDTRWAHVKDVSDVGVEDDGKERIVLGGGSTKYRYVLLWVTMPPADGTTVGISELSLLG